MKKKLISLLLVIFIILSFTLFSASAVFMPRIDYFTAMLEPFSEDALKSISHPDIKSISLIDSSGEDECRMLVVYPKNSNATDALYSYLVNHPLLKNVLPDITEIKENVRLENELQKISYVSPYDLNADKKVSAEDARLALRAAVQLEELPNFSVRAANGGNLYKMSAVTARRILRAATGLEAVPAFEINVGENEKQFVIGPIECSGAAGFDIRLLGETDKFKIEQKVFGADTLSVGGAVRCYFICTPLEKGSFTLKFEYLDIKHPEPIKVDEFSVEVNYIIKVIKEPSLVK